MIATCGEARGVTGSCRRKGRKITDTAETTRFRSRPSESVFGCVTPWSGRVAGRVGRRRGPTSEPTHGAAPCRMMLRQSDPPGSHGPGGRGVLRCPSFASLISAATNHDVRMATSSIPCSGPRAGGVTSESPAADRSPSNPPSAGTATPPPGYRRAERRSPAPRTGHRRDDREARGPSAAVSDRLGSRGGS